MTPSKADQRGGAAYGLQNGGGLGACCTGAAAAASSSGSASHAAARLRCADDDTARVRESAMQGVLGASRERTGREGDGQRNEFTKPALPPCTSTTSHVAAGRELCSAANAALGARGCAGARGGGERGGCGTCVRAVH